jgi:G3E family GTPase
MKVKVDVFSGFLGAGKTTLIKKLVSEGMYRENVVIIENEFGEVGIDGTLLKDTNIEVKEIKAGCICCSIEGDFREALKEVIERYNPSRIIIEPSGVAKLSEVLSVLKVSEIKDQVEINMVITIIDVLRFKTYITNFAEFYKNQIMNANTILLSRTQNVDEPKLLNIQQEISRLNSGANIVTTPWDKLSSRRIIELAEINRKMSVNEEVNLIRRPSSVFVLRNTKTDKSSETFETIGIETPKKFNFTKLKGSMDKIGQNTLYGNILRAKGIVQIETGEWVQFDYVPGEFQSRKTSPDYSGRLCVIGTKLNRENLKRLFEL